MEHALELMPEIVGDESVGIKYAINGLLSLTPDGLPVLGETPETAGLWSAAAVWVKEGPGVGRALAEWMVEGEPEIDLQASDVARFHEHQRSVEHVKARAAEGFNKTYGIVHPGEQWESNRGVRLSPFYERGRELGAVFYETAGWERPHWYESNAGLVEEFDVPGREAEWDSRWWSPIINAEHLAMRERAAMFDLTAFCVFDVVGPGALDSVQRVAMRQMDVKLGSVVYTPVLTPRGGFRSDLTIMRLGRRPLPRRHRRRARDGRPQVVPGPRDRRPGRRPDLELVHARPLGPARARHPGEHHERRRLARGLPVRELPHDRDGLAARAGVADLLRRRPRLGAVRPDRAGRAALGHGPRGRRAARRRAGGHRRLRHHRPAREVLPRLRVRARRRVRRGRGGDGLGQGQGRGLRRQGGARAPARVRPGGGDVHAHGGRPHVARAGPSATCSAASRSSRATARR